MPQNAALQSDDSKLDDVDGQFTLVIAVAPVTLASILGSVVALFGVHDGDGDGVGVGVGVGVATGPPQFVVLMFNDQPPAKLPRSPPTSSNRYRDHVPLGSVPLKIDRAEPPNGAGAGALNVSPVPMLVGWNVPLVKGPASDKAAAAASSSVNVRLVASGDPPTSDMMIAFCPAGPTSKISMSSGNE